MEFLVVTIQFVVMGFGQSEIYSTVCNCAFIGEIMFHMKKVVTFAFGCIPICLCSVYSEGFLAKIVRSRNAM